MGAASGMGQDGHRDLEMKQAVDGDYSAVNGTNQEKARDTHKERLNGMVADSGFEFDGPESGAPHWLGNLVRTDSLEVTNDPRISMDNVISKRLQAFEKVAVASILLASVSISTILAMEEPGEGFIEYAGLFMMNLVFVLNLFCVLIVTTQYYQIFRLMTSGPTGFEMSKSYYLNQNIMTLRHLSTSSFFYSIPIFILSIACMLWTKLRKGHTYLMAIPIVSMEVAAALFLFIAIKKHGDIFREKYAFLKKHERPLAVHTQSVHLSAHTAMWGGSGTVF